MDRRSFLFVHPSDDAYGSDRVLLTLVDEALAENGDVRVLLPDDMAEGWLTAQLRARGATVRAVPLAVARRRYLRPRQLPRYLAQLRRARRAVRDQMAGHPPDVVYVNTCAMPVLATVRPPARARVVWHVHELVVSPRPVAWFLRTLPAVAADVVVANSDAVATNLGRAPVQRGTIRRVHNGIPDRLPANGARPADSPRATYVGRLNRWKGYEVFVEAAGLVARDLPDARFSVAGGPPVGEEWRTDDLHRRLAAAGVADRTEVLGVCDDVAPLFDRSHVAVVPSLWPEPFGLVIVEAMRSGCAVVASDHGAAREIVDDGLTGLLVPPGDASATAAAVRRLLTDDDLRREMGERAAEVVRANFSDDRFRAEVREIWQGSGR